MFTPRCFLTSLFFSLYTHTDTHLPINLIVWQNTREIKANQSAFTPMLQHNLNHHSYYCLSNHTLTFSFKPAHAIRFTLREPLIQSLCLISVCLRLHPRDKQKETHTVCSIVRQGFRVELTSTTAVSGLQLL